MAGFLDRPRFAHQCRKVHALGPRPMAELLAEIADRTGEAEFIAARLEAYSRLPPATMRVLGADRFPPVVMEVVR